MVSPAVTREILIVYGNIEIQSVAAGTGVYALEDPIPAWIVAGTQVHITGCTSPANNGTFTVSAASGSIVTTDNSASVSEGETTGGDSPGVMGYPVGGGSVHLLDHVYFPDRGFSESVIRFRFQIANATESTFIKECISAEEAFRKPRQNLIITQNSTEILALRHSTNTGFDADPRIEKIEDAATGRSRKYTVVIKVGMPADNLVVDDGQPGRRNSTIDVAYTPARKRRVTISGTYTAVPTSTSARAQYEAKIDAYAAAVIGALSLTSYELGEEPRTEHNDTNKTIDFTRVYDEVLIEEPTSGIVRQVLHVSRNKIGPGDTPLANRMVTLNVNYEAWIDKDVSQALVSKWASIRSFIISQVRSTLGGGRVALVSEDPKFDFTDNRITATCVCLGTGTGNVIENRITTDVEDIFGKVLVPLWDSGGAVFSKYVYQGPATKRKTITQVLKVLGSPTSGGASSGGGSSAPNGPAMVSVGIGGPQTAAQITAFANAFFADSDPASGGPATSAAQEAGFIHISHRDSRTPLLMGYDGHTFDVTEIETVDVFEFAIAPATQNLTPTPG